MTTNLLSKETSPYLLQHQHNPVAWYPWGDEAFLRAKQENKAILLSIGYSACHWCHVMAHESFENQQIANIMNHYFISIKVDREERPDLDNYYQHALNLLGQQGGWPLTIFLMPDGKPFWGGTYLPPEPHYHLPGFSEVLLQIAYIYQNKLEDIIEIGQQINDAIIAQSVSSHEGSIGDYTLDLCDQTADQLLQHLDPIHGGMNGAPKFVQPPLFQFLWHAYRRTHQPHFKAAFLNLVTQVSFGGIYDHLGGGYARYSVDEFWLVPHFEKMLYDNALILELLIIAWQETHTPLFRQRMEETIAWLKRELCLTEGGFACAIDADSSAGEGQYYTWSEHEIDTLLKEHAQAFKTCYGITKTGNWEGRNILHLSSASEIIDIPDLTTLKLTLLTARQQRPRPQLDDKILADWNGLVICALATASMVCQQEAWLVMAQQAFSFIENNLFYHGKLSHSWCKGLASQIGFLEDYASMARAAIQLYEMSGNPHYLAQAENWVHQVMQDYLATEGGFFQSNRTLKDKVPGLIAAHDHVVPSNNSLMAHVLVKLYFITDKTNYRDTAQALFTRFKSAVLKDPMRYPALLNAYELLQDPLLIKFSNRDSNFTRECLKLIYEKPVTNLVISYLESNPKDRPYFLLCQNFSCSSPIYDTAQLKQILDKN